jgi:tRNA modification GTPase
MIFDFFMQDAPDLSADMVAISNVRHRDILGRAAASLDQYKLHSVEGVSPDLLATHLRDALLAVGEITGTTTPDDLLDLIFSTFCIGK